MRAAVVSTGSIGRRHLKNFLALGINNVIADYHPDEDCRISNTARSDLDGDVLLPQIHQIDYLNWLFDPFTYVSAVSGQQSGLDLDVDDNVTYLLHNENNVPVMCHLGYLQRPKHVTLEVFESRRICQWDRFANSLVTTSADVDAIPKTPKSPFNLNKLFMRSMKYFLGAIRSGTPPQASLRDGITSQKFVDAIRFACKSGRTAKIAT